jgi:hypothetical protein
MMDMNKDEAQQFRIRLDALIRQVWGAVSDLSRYRDGEVMTKEDYDLLELVSHHPAIQRVLDQALANEKAKATVKNEG